MPFDPDAPAVGDGPFGLPDDPDAHVVLVSVPWQATTSYRRGTRGGPAALVAASRQVDLQDLDVGAAWTRGIRALPADAQVEAWDLEAEPDALAVIASGGEQPEAAARVNALGERLNAWVYERAREVLARGAVPVVIGGDHSVPFGAIRAYVERFPGLGILHLDAHADLRAAYEGFTWSHASIFHNVMERTHLSRLVQVGVRDVGAAEVAYIAASNGRIRTFYDNDVARSLARGVTWQAICDEVAEALPEEVYLSFDVDGLDPSLCPNTGTPVPGGLSFRDVVVLLRTVAERRRLVGFDLNEIGAAEWDGNVAARLCYKLCGWVR